MTLLSESLSTAFDGTACSDDDLLARLDALPVRPSRGGGPTSFFFSGSSFLVYPLRLLRARLEVCAILLRMPSPTPFLLCAPRLAQPHTSLVGDTVWRRRRPCFWTIQKLIGGADLSRRGDVCAGRRNGLQGVLPSLVQRRPCTDRRRKGETTRVLPRHPPPLRESRRPDRLRLLRSSSSPPISRALRGPS